MYHQDAIDKEIDIIEKQSHELREMCVDLCIVEDIGYDCLDTEVFNCIDDTNPFWIRWVSNNKRRKQLYNYILSNIREIQRTTVY